jgi:hypothetical protein
MSIVLQKNYADFVFLEITAQVVRMPQLRGIITGQEAISADGAVLLIQGLFVAIVLIRTTKNSRA